MEATRPWDAEVEPSPEIAARVIARQFPELAPARAERLGAGWDNTAFFVNDRFIFRFPRRQATVALLEAEICILRLLAPHLPLPITVSTYIGAPSEEYPHLFAGYRRTPGTTACRLSWTDEARAGNATALGEFLAALHRIPVDAAVRTWARTEETVRPMSPLRDRLHAVAAGLDGIDAAALAELEAKLGTGPDPEGPHCWVHGDLYPGHLLVDEERRLCGVIDWGDVHIGCPAIDMVAAFAFLPPSARDAFRAAYGPIDAAIWDRARRHALHYGVSLIEYGRESGDEGMRAVGEYALRSAR